MKPFTFERGASPSAQPTFAYLAGGTTLVDLMRLNVLSPQEVIDINDLRATYGGIEFDENGLQLGALVHMAEAAEHDAVRSNYPLVAQALSLAASQQIRNMATLGGNVLQRTRCPYYRDTRWASCNKRDPGSGCAALEGITRKHAVLGCSSSCIAAYPVDFGQALLAMDAIVETLGPNGIRHFPFEKLHTLPGETPHIETSLLPGEIIVRFHIPRLEWARRSLYLKIRDRESYEFAVASAAIALDITHGRVREVRLAIGGVATKPWRAREAENVLVGQPVSRELAMEAGRVAFRDAEGRPDAQNKIEIGMRTVARAVLEASRLEI